MKLCPWVIYLGTFCCCILLSRYFHAGEEMYRTHAENTSVVCSPPWKARAQLLDAVSSTTFRACSPSLNVLRIRCCVFMLLAADDVPGKIILDQATLAEQQRGLEKIAQQLRRERLDKEAVDKVLFGFCPTAELWNGR